MNEGNRRSAIYARRIRWLSAGAMAAVVALAAAFAWLPLYRTARAGDSPFIAGCEAAVIIGTAGGAAWFMLYTRRLGEPLRPLAMFAFFATVAVVLLVSDMRVSTVSLGVIRSAPALATTFAITWLVMPARQPESAGAAAAEEPEEEPLDSTVLYRLYAADGELLYTGITRRPEARMRQHARDKEWWPQVAAKEIRAYRTREDAARAEHAAIMRENPRYNRARMELAAHLRMAVSQ